MSELRMFEEEITPEEEAITPSFQPSPEMEISPEAERCLNVLGGAMRICSKLDIAGKKVKVKVDLMGQRIGTVELNATHVSQEISANLGLVKGSAKITVNWGSRKVKADLKHCYKEFHGFSLRWKCEQSDYIIASW